MDIKTLVDKLILDKLDDEKLDELFIEFLKEPEWFQYYLDREMEIKNSKKIETVISRRTRTQREAIRNFVSPLFHP